MKNKKDKARMAGGGMMDKKKMMGGGMMNKKNLSMCVSPFCLCLFERRRYVKGDESRMLQLWMLTEQYMEWMGFL